jgi:hypothetical protein
MKQPGATDARPLDCLASLTRNREHSVRGSPLCHTRESGYPAGRDAAAQGLRLAGVGSSRNSVSVVVSWMPAFAGMTRGKRPIQAPVVYSKGTGRRPVRTLNDGGSRLTYFSPSPYCGFAIRNTASGSRNERR